MGKGAEMKYYEVEINYNEKHGSLLPVAVPKKMSNKALLKHLQKTGEVEPFQPRDFDAYEMTKEEYEAYYG